METTNNIRYTTHPQPTVKETSSLDYKLTRKFRRQRENKRQSSPSYCKEQTHDNRPLKQPQNKNFINQQQTLWIVSNPFYLIALAEHQSLLQKRHDVLLHTCPSYLVDLSQFTVFSQFLMKSTIYIRMHLNLTIRNKER